MKLPTKRLQYILGKLAILLVIWSIVSAVTAVATLWAAPQQVNMWLGIAGVQLTAAFILGAIAAPDLFIKLKTEANST